MVPLWFLLILVCAAMPIGTAIGVARHTNVGFGGYALADAAGLTVGCGSAWAMWIARKIFLYRRSGKYSVIQQKRFFRLFYFVMVLWIVFAGFLGAWLALILLRLAYRG
jgi:hypothetical protein